MKKYFISLFTAFLIAFNFIVPVLAAEDDDILLLDNLSISVTSGSSVSEFIFNDATALANFNSRLASMSDDPIYQGCEDFIKTTYPGYVPVFSANYYSDKYLYLINPSFNYTFKLSNSGITVNNSVMAIYLSSSGPRQYNYGSQIWIQNLSKCTFFTEYFNNEAVFDNAHLSLKVVPLGIDVDGFAEFYKLTANGYLKRLSDYFGESFIQIDSSTIKFLVSYYNAYGSSDKNFAFGVPDLAPIFKDGYFINTSIASIPLPSIFIHWSDYQKFMAALRVRFQSDYQDYLKMKSMLLPDVVPNVTHDNDLIVDIDTDTTDITLLREIIRFLANISNNLTVNFSSVIGGINGIANLLANIDFNLNPDIDVDLLGVNNLVGVMNNLVAAINNFSFSGPDPDESYLEYLFVPTFDEFDELFDEAASKYPIIDQLSYLPDSNFDDVIGIESHDSDLFSTYAASDDPVLPGFNEDEYNFNYSESDISSRTLFNFTVPEGQDDPLLHSIEGLQIGLVDYSKFGKAIKLFKGIISVIAVFIFSKWLLTFIPKVITGYNTSD